MCDSLLCLLQRTEDSVTTLEQRVQELQAAAAQAAATSAAAAAAHRELLADCENRLKQTQTVRCVVNAECLVEWATSSCCVIVVGLWVRVCACVCTDAWMHACVCCRRWSTVRAS
jgi:hypothetical protein